MANSAPVLSDLNPVLVIGENVYPTPTLIDADVTVSDPDGNFEDGTLAVTGLFAGDHLSIRDQGLGAGQIGYDAVTGEVRYEGVLIGMASGGDGIDFVVTFNAAADSTAIEALVENLTYALDAPGYTGSFDVTVTLTDGAGASNSGLAQFTAITDGSDVVPAFSERVNFSFADIDGDGDADMVVSSLSWTGLRYFENTGDASAPVFTEQTGTPADPFTAVSETFDSPLLYDLDGDGDFDLIGGGYGGLVTYYENTGTELAGVFEARTGAQNPFEDTPGSSGTASVALGDVDGDGLADLLVGEFNGGLTYYKNTGTASDPVFTVQTGSDNPFDAIAPGDFLSSPALVDLDGDGDLDLDLGASEGHRYFENTGTASSPVMTEHVGGNPFPDMFDQSRSAFVDLDGDGDLDDVVAGYGGGMTSYINAAPVGTVLHIDIQSDLPQLSDLTFQIILLQSEVQTPQLLDGDVTVTDPAGGLADGSLKLAGVLPEDNITILAVGDGVGEINYDAMTGVVSYGGVAIGTASGGDGADFVVDFNSNADAASVEALIERLAFSDTDASFTQTRSLQLQLFNAAGESSGDAHGFVTQSPLFGYVGAIFAEEPTPALADLDGDGDLDMIMGDAYGQISLLVNIGDSHMPLFAPIDGLFYNLPTIDGGYSSPALADIDGDGDFDLIVGNDYGGIQVFENTRSGAAGPYFEELTGADNPFDGVSLSGGGAAPTFADVDGDGLVDAVIGTGDNVLHYFHNTGTAEAPVFTEQFGGDNPFEGVTAASGYIVPALGDIDGDGDLDLYLGDADWGYFYENQGTAQAPNFVLGQAPFQPPLGGATHPVFADIDADGDLDMVAGSSDYQSLIIYTQGAQGTTFEVFIGPDAPAAPTLSGVPGEVTFDENLVNGAPQDLITGAVFGDVDGIAWLGILTVTGVLPEDTIGIRNEGTGAGQIGYDEATGFVTYGGALVALFCGCTGGDVTFGFSPLADNAAVQAVINALTYSNNSDDPTPTRTLYLAYEDQSGQGLAGSAIITAHELTGFSNPFDGMDLGDNATPIGLNVDFSSFDEVVVRTSDGLLTVLQDTGGFGPMDPADNPFSSLALGGDTPFLIIDTDVDGDYDIFLVDGGGILRSYENDGGVFVANPGLNANALEGVDVGAGARSLVFDDLDGDFIYELKVGGGDGTIRFFTFDTNFTLVEAFGAANPFAGIDVGTNAAPAFFDLDDDGDADLIVGAGDGTLHYFRNDAGVFTEQAGAANPFDGIDVGTNAAPAVIDVVGSFDPELVVGAGDGTLHTYGIDSLSGIAIVVNVTPQAETPPVADDAVSTAENAVLNGDVTADNGDGADAGGTVVEQVNDSIFTPGVAITLPSGARLTMNADGTFSYDPNGRFDYLADMASGASSTTATDSFTYRTDQGDLATVTVTIDGVDSNKDLLDGTPGDDVINGGLGNDILNGGDGGDDLAGGVANDILNGDAGDDSLSGGDGSDKLFGGDGIDTLHGDAGADRLDGGDGTDVLDGGGDNDLLDGGIGADSMTGGLGNDVFMVDDAGDQTLEAADGGYDIVRTALDGWVLGANFEGLELQGTADIGGFGNSGANNLQGNDGANTLSGLAGVDTINGNDGDDIIIGGAGGDLLRGGGGTDTFVVRQESVGAAVLENDTVYDYSAGDNDRIDLSAIDANSIQDGDQGFTLVGAFDKHAGQMTLTFASGQTTLKLDVNGDGRVDYQMKINGDVTGESGHWLL
jgi:VCBS repeat-containing protein